MGRSGASPAQDAEYAAGHEVMPRVAIDDDIATITGLRDTQFPAPGEKEARWIEHTCDLRDVTNLWVFFGFFGSVRGVAHSELVFEFADNRNLTASFEIRPRKGQRYTIKAGMGKNFQLALRWTTERDAMLRRVMGKKIDTEMHLLEADITQPRIVELFRAASAKTNQLADQPEWYHSVTNTCTTNMVALVDEIMPGQLRRTPRVVLPGLLPKLWAKQGVLKLDGSFADTMAEAHINDRCIEIGDVDDFSAQLHGRL